MSAAPRSAGSRSVALVTLGCGRNEVDSEELAARLGLAGHSLVDDPTRADAVLVNTCGFVDTAKKDSIDTILGLADLKAGSAGTGSGPQAVVAVGCLAERYGDELASGLPEADAVLGFDHYPDVAARLEEVLDGSPPPPHVPHDRRTSLPVAPADRRAGPRALPQGGALRVDPPDLPDGIAPATGPRVLRRRLGSAPYAPLKIASGCDRRCSFCAIPSFRGAFVSRSPAELLAEARWLADHGVRELVLVSENSTSYGKDLGDLRLLESLLPALAGVQGILRVRVSYLQPAEMRPSLLDVMTDTPGVVPYFDLSFQHASPPVLRRMRRFGGTERFCDLLDEIRRRAPHAGVRTNVIVGFPGEDESDVEELESFLRAARLDAVGVFGYSAEEGTEAARLDGRLPADEVDERVRRIGDLVERLSAERAEDRIGEHVRVLVERVGEGLVEGCSEHQAPEVDGVTVVGVADTAGVCVGDLVTASVTGTEGVDLVGSVDHGEAVAGGQTGAPREVP